MLRLLVSLAVAHSSSAFLLAATVAPEQASAMKSARAENYVVMKRADDAREQLLPDIVKGLNAVSKFVSSGKLEPPTAEDIEKFCAAEQKKIDLLLEEASLMKAEGGSKVKWTDIDGNKATDAAWLK